MAEIVPTQPSDSLGDFQFLFYNQPLGGLVTIKHLPRNPQERPRNLKKKKQNTDIWDFYLMEFTASEKGLCLVPM